MTIKPLSENNRKSGQRVYVSFKDSFMMGIGIALGFLFVFSAVFFIGRALIETLLYIF